MPTVLDKPKPLCNRCASSKVTCRSQYFTTGGDMEHVDFLHHCDDCQHEESAIQQGSYGYDNEYQCPLRHDLLIDPLYESDSPELVEPKLYTELCDFRREFFRYLSQHPERLFHLSPRRFEELVADILRDFGFDVHLTPQTRDGGKDMYAYLRTEVTSLLIFVECKRWAFDRPVGIDIVQRMYGACRVEEANKGVIVTTSFFTSPALSEREKIAAHLDLCDYERLKAWLAKCASKDSEDIEP